MGDIQPPSKTRQFSLAALFGVITAVGAIFGLVHWLGAYPLLLVPTIVGVGLIYAGFALRMTQVSEWGVVLLILEVLLILFAPMWDFGTRTPSIRNACANRLSQVQLAVLVVASPEVFHDSLKYFASPPQDRF